MKTGGSISVEEWKKLTGQGKQGGKQVEPATKKQPRVRGYRKTVTSGRKYDSKKEAVHGEGLILMEKKGYISDLEFQPRFPFVCDHPVNVRTRHGNTRYYRADFAFIDCRTGKRVIQDVKGMLTDIYLIKSDVAREFYGIEIEEI